MFLFVFGPKGHFFPPGTAKSARRRIFGPGTHAPTHPRTHQKRRKEENHDHTTHPPNPRTHSPTHTYTPTHLHTHAPTNPLAHPPTYPRTHAHLHTYSPTHPLTHQRDAIHENLARQHENIPTYPPTNRFQTALQRQGGITNPPKPRASAEKAPEGCKRKVPNGHGLYRFLR